MIATFKAKNTIHIARNKMAWIEKKMLSCMNDKLYKVLQIKSLLKKCRCFAVRTLMMFKRLTRK